MPCCAPALFPFSNAFVANVAYDDALKAIYGSTPRVEVLAYDAEAGNYYSLNGLPGFQIKFDGNNVNVDFGGQTQGFIRIS